MVKRSSKQKILATLLFSMVFLALFTKININTYRNNNANINQKIQNDDKIKVSDVITDLIRINGSATGQNAHNWTWAKSEGYVSQGDGSKGDPYIIDNLEIDGQNLHSGIEIVDSRDDMAIPIYFRIENNLIYNVGGSNFHSAGIKLYRTQHGTIRNNIISSNRDGNYGIHLVGKAFFMMWPPYMDTTKDINITENIITNTQRGIYIEDACEDITVSKNVAKYNTLAGIYIAKRCVSIEIINNILSENNVFGIADTDSNNHKPPDQYPDQMWGNTIKNNTISNNAYGFYLAQTRAATISYNNISSNSMNGMYISGSSWNKIANNTISNNVEKGIFMAMGPTGSFRNMIYGNKFIGNGEHAVEQTNAPPFPVMDEFWMITYWENNWSWYKSGIMSPKIGNYWDNYTGADKDDDGVGDSSHDFIGNSDPLPTWNDGIEGHVIAINDTWNAPNNWDWAKGRFWCEGSGTLWDPYVIGPNENWDGNIDAWGKDIGILIIESISKNFKIEDTTITNSTKAGIKLNNVKWMENEIVNNNINSNDGHGISLKMTNFVNITKNIVTNNKGTGIYINNDTGGPGWGITVIDNTISDNDVDGVYIGENSDETLIRDNTIADNGRYGVNINETTVGPMGGCNNTNLFYNVLIGNPTHARDTGTDTNWYLDTFNLKRGNYWDDYGGVDADDDGIGDTPYTDIVPSGEDKYPIWDDDLEETALFIDGMAMGVGAHNWSWASKRLFVSGSGFMWDPYVIENVRFDGNNAKSPITIINSMVYFRIKNCTLDNIGSGKAGIYLNNTDNGDLINSTFSSSNGGNYGIHITDWCNNINITDNLIEANPTAFKYGIFIEDNCMNIYVIGNIIRNIGTGILLTDMSSWNDIFLNEIRYNTNGIVINGTSWSNNIVNNTIIWNFIGIQIYENSATNNIIGNEIMQNTKYGLYVNSSGNFIYYNNFTTNTGINAHDDTKFGFNTWYEAAMFRGNFWSNYTTLLYSVEAKDEDDDGIGDIRYNLTGIAKAQDWFPIYDDGHNGSKIIIDGNAAPYTHGSWEWAASRTWCSGSGTINDPYVIKGLEINGQLNSSCIYIFNSDGPNQNFRIENSVFYNSSATASPEPAGGIRLVNVKNGTIINNIISNNDGHGIILRSSFGPEETANIIIQNNVIENNNGTGIYINGSNVHDNIIYNNTISSNAKNGISVSDNAYENIISNNILYDNADIGIYVKDFQPIWPTMYWDPIEFKWVYEPWDKNYIYNNTITLGDTGIGIESSYLVIISGNTITQTDSNGIAIGDFNSRNITILSNTIYNNDQYGINFGWDNPSHTENNYILENNIYNNVEAGIILQQCYGSTFSNNTVDGNGIGIGLSYLNSFNEFTNNMILDNTYRGLAVYDLSCESNKIYNNNFTGNGINAEDLGISNEWYFMNIGNYWADFTGKDANDDGIGDIPYDNIDGFMNPKDYFPKWWDTIVFNNDFVDQFGFPLQNNEFRKDPPRFKINITEGKVDYFWYEIAGFGSSKPIKISPGLNIIEGNIDIILWNSLPNGTKTITFYLNDSQGYISSFDEVVMKIISPPPSGGVLPDEGDDSSTSTDEKEEEGLPWWLQAIFTGMISASAGLVIKISYSAHKRRKELYKKISDNLDRVDNIEKFLQDRLGFEDWNKLKESLEKYRKNEISSKQLVKQSKKSVGKKFMHLFVKPKPKKKKK